MKHAELDRKGNRTRRERRKGPFGEERRRREIQEKQTKNLLFSLGPSSDGDSREEDHKKVSVRLWHSLCF